MGAGMLMAMALLWLNSLHAQNCAFFSYPKDTICMNTDSIGPDFIATPGGSFSAPAGLVIDANGVIDALQSMAGTYPIEYAVGGTCGLAFTVNVTLIPANSAYFQYPNNADLFCAYEDTVFIDSAGTPSMGHGIFQSSDPLNCVIDSAGNLYPALSTPGTYFISHSVDVGTDCESSLTRPITIADYDRNASFSYPQESYCQNDPDAVPNLVADSSTQFFVSMGGIFTDLNGTISTEFSITGIPLVITAVVGELCPVSLEDTLTVYLAPDPMILANTVGDSLAAFNGSPGDTYVWTLDGTPFSTDSVASPPGTGQVVLEVTNSFGCTGRDTLDFAVGIADQQSPEIQVELFPNPGQGAVELLLTTANRKAADLELRDMYGRVLWERKALAPGRIAMDWRTLPAGLYFVQLRQGDQMRRLSYLKR